jgi:hypothetical protein
MKFIAYLFLAVVALVVWIQFSDPVSPYKRIDGEWCYVTWNEAVGRRVTNLAADSATFHVLRGGRYAKDSARVFFDGQPIPNCHAPSFDVLPKSTTYGKDAHRVFVFKYEIVGADSGSFALIEEPYGQDTDTVYCGNVPMPDVRRGAFEVMGGSPSWSMTFDRDLIQFKYGNAFDDVALPVVAGRSWARDGTSYYYGPGEVVDADYESFQIIDSMYAIDKWHKFYGVAPMNLEPQN